MPRTLGSVPSAVPYCYDPPPTTEPGPTPVRSFQFDITCPVCSRQTLEYVAPGTTDALTARSVVRCPKCKRSYLLTVRLENLRPITTKALQP